MSKLRLLFPQRRPIVTAFALVGATAFWLVSAHLASSSVSALQGSQRPASFANESLQGSYAVVGIGGAHQAASVGVTRFDGTGGAYRKLVLNELDPDSGERMLLTITANGTYEVYPDGTGSARFVNELPDGSEVPFTFDFVITEAQPRGSGRFLEGLGLHMVQREPGIAAKLVTFTLTRLTS